MSVFCMNLEDLQDRGYLANMTGCVFCLINPRENKQEMLVNSCTNCITYNLGMYKNKN